MSFILGFLLVAVLFLISAALAILVIGPLMLLQPTRRTRDWYAVRTTLLEPSDAALPQETVDLRTDDGTILKGWLIRKKNARGTILYLHGVGDCRIAGIPMARYLYQNGYNVFLYDSRRHGESGGRYCTYGYYEKNDVTAAITYLKGLKRFRLGKVGIFGTSMGAAVAIQAAAIDSRIAAVVAEACFTDLRTIMVDYQRRIAKLPWHFLRNVAMSRAQKIARFKAWDVSPLEEVKHLTIPLFFIHGTADALINYEYSKTLYHHARDPKELLLVPGANHTDIWEIGGHVYQSRLLSFFDHNLQKRSRSTH